MHATPMVLVCTDRASRGIDTAHVEHVVLFDFPRDPSEYVRRAGRVSRGAGGTGLVSILVLGRQVCCAELDSDGPCRLASDASPGHSECDTPMMNAWKSMFCTCNMRFSSCERRGLDQRCRGMALTPWQPCPCRGCLMSLQAVFFQVTSRRVSETILCVVRV